MSATTTAVRRSAAPALALGTVRVLLGLMASLQAAATVFFTFVASPEEGGVVTPVDWVVAAWSMTIAVGWMYAAVRLGDRTRRTLWVARGFVLAHVAFGLVKLLAYDERVYVFFGVDLLLLVLLGIAGRRR